MRVVAIALLLLGVVSIAGCASNAPSGTAPSSRNTDPLDPVNDFPQVRGPYMRQ
jgi:hypothetical protein